MPFSAPTPIKTSWSVLDVLIAAAIVLFGLYWLLGRADTDNAAARVLIYKEQRVVETAPLMTDTHIDLATHGVSMVVEIRDKRVRVRTSSCKEQICVRKGWTGQVHDPIICLPNKVSVELTGTDARYDAISR